MLTLTVIVIEEIRAGGVILTWTSFVTCIDEGFAVVSSVTEWANTRITVNLRNRQENLYVNIKKEAEENKMKQIIC